MNTVDSILLAVELVALQGDVGKNYFPYNTFLGITLKDLWKQYPQDKIALDSHVKQFIWNNLQSRDDITLKENSTDIEKNLSFVAAESKESSLVLIASKTTRYIALGVNLLDVQSFFNIYSFLV